MAIGVPEGVDLVTYYVVDPLWRELTPYLEGKELILHNAHFDLRVLADHGWVFTGTFWDTMLMAHLCDENQFSYELDSLGLQHFGVRKKSINQWEKVYGWDKIPDQVMGEYACVDLAITWRLYVKYRAELERQELTSAWLTSAACVRSLIDLAGEGLRVDWGLVDALSSEAQASMADTVARLGWTPTKTSRLHRALHGSPEAGGLGLPVTWRTPKDKARLDSDALRLYAQEYPECESLVTDVIEYRKLAKAVSTWYEGFKKYRTVDCIHPGIKQHGTRTGRFSCADPNLQQLPRDSSRVKKIFLDKPGFKLVEYDYSQIELRLGAIYAKGLAGDSLMYNTYKQGEDVHHLTATLVGAYDMVPNRHEARQAGKQGNFLWIYGGGAARLQDTLRKGYGIHVTLSQCEVWSKAFHSAYPGFKKAGLICEKKARQQGYVKLWNGRRRHLRKTDKDEPRLAFNSIIQGGGAVIIQEAMNEIRARKLPSRMALQVHDSIVFYVPENDVDKQSEIIKGIMSKAPTERWGLPFEVDHKKWHD